MIMLVLHNCSKVIQDTEISRNVHLAYFIRIKVIITKMRKKNTKKQEEEEEKESSRLS